MTEIYPSIVLLQKNTFIYSEKNETVQLQRKQMALHSEYNSRKQTTQIFDNNKNKAARYTNIYMKQTINIE
jgi:hypothetical protein